MSQEELQRISYTIIYEKKEGGKNYKNINSNSHFEKAKRKKKKQKN